MCSLLLPRLPPALPGQPVPEAGTEALLAEQGQQGILLQGILLQGRGTAGPALQAKQALQGVGSSCTRHLSLPGLETPRVQLGPPDVQHGLETHLQCSGMCRY